MARYFALLGQVLDRPMARLRMRCDACGHAAEWSRRQALSVFSPYTVPCDVARLLKCGVCGERRRIDVGL